MLITIMAVCLGVSNLMGIITLRRYKKLSDKYCELLDDNIRLVTALQRIHSGRLISMKDKLKVVK